MLVTTIPVYMMSIESIAPSQPETDYIMAYLERIDIYTTVNNFPEQKKVASLISIMGGPLYKVQCSLLAPDLLEKATRC